jgi:hypothetical protein
VGSEGRLRLILSGMWGRDRTGRRGASRDNVGNPGVLFRLCGNRCQEVIKLFQSAAKLPPYFGRSGHAVCIAGRLCIGETPRVDSLRRCCQLPLQQRDFRP